METKNLIKEFRMWRMMSILCSLGTGILLIYGLKTKYTMAFIGFFALLIGTFGCAYLQRLALIQYKIRALQLEIKIWRQEIHEKIEQKRKKNNAKGKAHIAKT